MKISPVLFLFALATTSASSALANGAAKLAPLYQCVLEIPKGAWVTYEYNGNQRQLKQPIEPIGSTSIIAEAPTLLVARQKIIDSCANNMYHEYYAYLQGDVQSKVDSGTALASYDACKDFIAKRRTALKCEMGYVAACE